MGLKPARIAPIRGDSFGSKLLPELAARSTIAKHGLAESEPVSATAIELNRPETAQSHVDLPIQGMTCSACATRLEGALSQAPGMRSATVNFALERADVSL